MTEPPREEHGTHKNGIYKALNVEILKINESRLYC